MKCVVQHCFGEFDSGQSCDCGMKLYCKDFTKYIKMSGDNISEYIKLEPDPNTTDGVIGILIMGKKRFIEFLGSKNCIISEKEIKQTKKVFSKAKKKRKKKRTEDTKVRQKIMNGMFVRFREALEKQLVGWTWSNNNKAITVGKLYVVNRIKKSKYWAIMCKTSFGWDKTVAVVRPRLRTITLDVELPIEYVNYGIVSHKKLEYLSPNPVNKWFCKSVIRRCDDVKLAIVAGVIGDLVKRGKIELPNRHPRSL